MRKETDSGGWIQYIIGICVGGIGIWLMNINLFGRTFISNISTVLDPITLLILVLLSSAGTLLCRPKSIIGFVNDFKNIVIPIGGVLFCIYCIYALGDNDYVSLQFSIGYSIIPLLYSLLLFIITYIIYSSERRKTNEKIQ